MSPEFSCVERQTDLRPGVEKCRGDRYYELPIVVVDATSAEASVVPCRCGSWSIEGNYYDGRDKPSPEKVCLACKDVAFDALAIARMARQRVLEQIIVVRVSS